MYLICFSLSLLVMSLSFKMSNKYGIYKKILLIFALLLPCMLAALRDYSIGTDVNVYINPLYVLAKDYSSFINYYNDVNIVKDFLYLLITYISAKLGNIGFLFFIIEVLIVFPLYHSMNLKFKNKQSIIFGFLLFYLFFFNQTLNMARQSIAISFVIYGIANLEFGRDKFALFLFLIATLFHNTAIVSFGLYIIFKVYDKIKNQNIYTKREFLIDILLVSISISILLLIRPIINTIGNFGFLSSNKVQNYSIKYYRESLDFSFINTFIYSVTFLTLWCNRKNLKKIDIHYHFHLVMSLISIILLQLGMIVAFSDRIVYYIFYPILFLNLPQALFEVKNRSSKNNFLFKTFIIFVFILYWIYWIYYLNYNGTYPFVFRNL